MISIVSSRKAFSMTWGANGRKMITLVSKHHSQEQVVDLGLPPNNEALGRTTKTSFRGLSSARGLRMVSLQTGGFSSSVLLASVAGVESHIG